MRILVVAATDPEIAPLVGRLGSEPAGQSRITSVAYHVHTIDLLTTGVGMVATAAWTSRALAGQRYDLALNFGLCGSFTGELSPGSVVHVVSDRLTELGAEDDASFLTIHELTLLGDNDFPFEQGAVVNGAPPRNAAIARLPRANGITVNTVHGNVRSIAAVVDRFRPDVESMEGAAFMYSCRVADVPFAQVRAVSNIVEKRNRAAWRITDAIHNLGTTAVDILDHA